MAAINSGKLPKIKDTVNKIEIMEDIITIHFESGASFTGHAYTAEKPYNNQSVGGEIPRDFIQTESCIADSEADIGNLKNHSVDTFDARFLPIEEAIIRFCAKLVKDGKNVDGLFLVKKHFDNLVSSLGNKATNPLVLNMAHGKVNVYQRDNYYDTFGILTSNTLIVGYLELE